MRFWTRALRYVCCFILSLLVTAGDTTMHCLVSRPGYGLVSETCPRDTIACRIRVEKNTISFYDYSPLYDRNQFACVMRHEYGNDHEAGAEHRNDGCVQKKYGGIRCWCSAGPNCNTVETGKRLYSEFLLANDEHNERNSKSNEELITVGTQKVDPEEDELSGKNQQLEGLLETQAFFEMGKDLVETELNRINGRRNTETKMVLLDEITKEMTKTELKKLRQKEIEKGSTTVMVEYSTTDSVRIATTKMPEKRNQSRKQKNLDLDRYQISEELRKQEDQEQIRRDHRSQKNPNEKNGIETQRYKTKHGDRNRQKIDGEKTSISTDIVPIINTTNVESTVIAIETTRKFEEGKTIISESTTSSGTVTTSSITVSARDNRRKAKAKMLTSKNNRNQENTTDRNRFEESTVKAHDKIRGKLHRMRSEFDASRGVHVIHVGTRDRYDQLVASPEFTDILNRYGSGERGASMELPELKQVKRPSTTFVEKKKLADDYENEFKFERAAKSEELKSSESRLSRRRGGYYNHVSSRVRAKDESDATLKMRKLTRDEMTKNMYYHTKANAKNLRDNDEDHEEEDRNLRGNRLYNARRGTGRNTVNLEEFFDGAFVASTSIRIRVDPTLMISILLASCLPISNWNLAKFLIPRQ